MASSGKHFVHGLPELQQMVGEQTTPDPFIITAEINLCDGILTVPVGRGLQLATPKYPDVALVVVEGVGADAMRVTIQTEKNTIKVRITSDGYTMEAEG